MPKRTAEQALRDDWKVADKAVKDGKVALDVAAMRLGDAMKARDAKREAWTLAKARRSRVQFALEALVGDKITQHEEDDDGEQAAPATPGADEEVQPGSERKDDAK